MAFPARLQRCDVYDEAAAGVGAFAEADNQHIARDAEIFNRVRQHETVGRYYANIGLPVNKTLIREVLGIDERVVDIGKDFEVF